MAGQDMRAGGVTSRADAAREVDAWRSTARRPLRAFLVLDAGPNPSTDYYVRPRLAAVVEPVTYRDVGRDAPRDQDLDEGTFVVFVRVASPAWVLAVERAQSRLGGIAYFMDDDLWDLRSHEGLPLGHRARLARRAFVYRPWFTSRASHLWVSSTALATKYASPRRSGPLLLPPTWPVEPGRAFAETGARVRIAYHGTRAHLAEMRWLAPIVRDVVDACPEVDFEAIGDASVREVFAGIARAVVLPPMSWPAYRAHGESAICAIGLAPLVPSAFNATRACTKVLDHTRLGAVGVYSTPGPYDHAVRDGVDGLCLPLDAARWTRELVALVRDRPRLDGMRRAALARASCR